MSENISKEIKMPVLFVGHGSPMNTIEDNEFTQSWEELGRNIPTPKAILCISAHWETNGTAVTSMKEPKTIHDFGGFPQALYALEYPAPGSPVLAMEVKQHLISTFVKLDLEWGLDHGCWCILQKMYPKADIPVVQLSIDHYKTEEFHYLLAKELAWLRNEGVLILCSGNMVHNLHLIEWDPYHSHAWAEEANELFKRKILENDHQSLINYTQLNNAVQKAIPTAEHYIPMLYALGLKEKDEKVRIFNDKVTMGSLSMTSFIVGE